LDNCLLLKLFLGFWSASWKHGLKFGGVQGLGKTWKLTVVSFTEETKTFKIMV